MGTWESALQEVRAACRSGKITSALSHLAKAATALSKELEDERRLDGDSEQVKVVHYTSLETAHALLVELSIQYLRLYDSVHLTDPQEGWYVFGDHDFFREGRISKWLESPVSHAYILSFLPFEDDAVHKSYDHLSHWRAYGDNGGGCSFVFSVPQHRLYEVNYEDAARDATATKLRSFLDTAARVWEDVSQAKSASIYPYYEELLGPIFATALKSRFLHKHPSYALERERRAVVAAPELSEIQTHVIGRNIRHYVKDGGFDMCQLLNSECTITVGPAVHHQTDVAITLQGILVRNGRSGPKVDVSKVPYRSV
jgi:hypothetical protein